MIGPGDYFDNIEALHAHSFTVTIDESTGFPTFHRHERRLALPINLNFRETIHPDQIENGVLTVKVR